MHLEQSSIEIVWSRKRESHCRISPQWLNIKVTYLQISDEDRVLPQLWCNALQSSSVDNQEAYDDVLQDEEGHDGLMSPFCVS